MSDLLIGTSKSDVINGSDSSEVIDAGAGNDVVTAGAGDDTVNGGDGNDRLDGGDGNDTLHGDDGNDRLYGREGNDWLYGESGNDWLWGSSGNDSLYGNSGNDALFGEQGDDVLMGGAGDDRLDGSDGNDTLLGDEGDDFFIAGEGYDSCLGGDGIDTVSYENAQGKVYVVLNNPNGLFMTIKNAEGQPDATQNSSISGADLLLDIENVIGSYFDDAITGNNATNRLEGGAGNDLLVAVGSDTLVGGSGGDIFVFNSQSISEPWENAQINDFSAAEGDKIDLSRFGIDTSGALHDLGFITIQENPGQSIITIYKYESVAGGANFIVGGYVVNVMHSSLENLPLNDSDFVLF